MRISIMAADRKSSFFGDLVSLGIGTIGKGIHGTRSGDPSLPKLVNLG